MDDLVADIDRGTIGLQRQHHDLDRPIDAGAEAARAAEADREGADREGRFFNLDVHSGLSVRSIPVGQSR